MDANAKSCALIEPATPAMSDPTAPPFAFPSVRGKKLTAAFDGGRLTSDGGVMLLALAAYVAYVINAAQFLLKLRAARLEEGTAGGLGQMS